MLSVIFLCAIWCACGVLVWRAHARKRSTHPLPPVLSGGLPIIGHNHQLTGDTKALWGLLNSMSRECMEKGGVIYANIGTDIYYFITDPDDALTAANACMQKHFVYDFVKPWLGNGLFTSSGELWQRHRRLLNPAFTVSVIHNFLGIFNDMSKQFINEVDAHAGKGSFDPSSYLKVIAFRTFSRTAFGISDASVKDFAQKYMESSDQIMNMVVNRFQNVLLHSNIIYQLSGLKKKADGLIKTLDVMANQVIKKKKEEMKFTDDKDTSELAASGTRYKPLMNLLLELKNDDTLTDKEIKEEVDTAIIAGFDTTSNLMTCILVLLGSYPEVQQRMYEEMIEVLGKDREVEKDDIKRLVYTEAVIKEALRLFPTGPALFRTVDKDVKLKNYTMRAGTHCVVLTLGTHRDPLWGEDVEQFRPERWLDPAVTSLGNSAFYGFSLGKRSCIGKAYALISMKVTLSHFVRRYQVTSDVNKMHVKVDMILKPVSAAISIEHRH